MWYEIGTQRDKGWYHHEFNIHRPDNYPVEKLREEMSAKLGAHKDNIIVEKIRVYSP